MNKKHVSRWIEQLGGSGLYQRERYMMHIVRMSDHSQVKNEHTTGT